MHRIMNTGLDLEKERLDSSEEDWVFGAVSMPCLAQIPEADRIKYLPKGEVQKGAEDTMDCATRGPINVLETKFNWMLKNGKISPQNEAWLRERGYITENGVEFSDAFIAILSGTTERGNSLKAPLEAIRQHGLIPKRMLPLEPWMTWKDYHDRSRITGSMHALGEDFKARFPMNYEKVFETDYPKLLKEDLLVVGGYAWPDPVDGVYPRVGFAPNHCFDLVEKLEDPYAAFDNYLDTDGDFLKKLASDYDMLDYGYRIYVRKEIVRRKNWLLELLGF
jgi:hypothetical protein